MSPNSLFIHTFMKIITKSSLQASTGLQQAPRSTPRLQPVSPRALYYLGKQTPGSQKTSDKYKQRKEICSMCRAHRSIW